MLTRLFYALCLATVFGCSPWETANGIYSADAPGKSGTRTRNYVSNGDPRMLKSQDRPVETADWRELPPAQ